MSFNVAQNGLYLSDSDIQLSDYSSREHAKTMRKKWMEISEEEKELGVSETLPLERHTEHTQVLIIR